LEKIPNSISSPRFTGATVRSRQRLDNAPAPARMT
jgi:hypothetical protein